MSGYKRFRAGALAIVCALLAAACEERSIDPIEPGTPLIVISVDTLRSDRLPMYGYERIRTPALDDLRSDSVLYESAYSPVPLTLPAHVSLFTGQDPDFHGVRDNVGYRISPSSEMLPGILSDHGYQTGAAVSAWVMGAETGLGADFDFYDDDLGASTTSSIALVQRAGGETTSRALDWIRPRSGEPFFFFLHLYEPHTPYEPPEDLAGAYEDPYDGEIVAIDRIVGDFLEELKALAIYDRALIVFLADHGEGLGDHGEPGHGIFLYRESIQVPLLIKLPNSTRRGESIQTPVSLIDVPGTLLNLLGVDVPETMTDVSILDPLDADRPVYSETLYPRMHFGWSELRSIVSGSTHYIEAPRPELYDLATDFGETSNILAERRRTFAALRGFLDDRALAFAEPSSVDPENLAKLAALGYLGGGASPGNGDLPDPKDKVDELAMFTKAMNLASAGEDERAIVAFRGLVDEDSSFVEGWLQLGRLLEQSGRLEDALEAHQSAMELSPARSGDTALTIAAILFRLGRLAEAREHVEVGRASNPPRAALILARIAYAERDYAEAEKHLRAMTPGPYRDESDVLLATVLVASGKLGEAMALVEEIERRANDMRSQPPAGLSMVRGDILGRMNRLDEAAAAFNRELDLYPKNLQAYAGLALVRSAQGRRDEAREVIHRMVRANPTVATRRYAAASLERMGMSADLPESP